MVAEEVVITLAGGAPWGFRLQGGVEQQKPLQVAKVTWTRGGRTCPALLRGNILNLTSKPALDHFTYRHLLIDRLDQVYPDDLVTSRVVNVK